MHTLVSFPLSFVEYRLLVIYSRSKSEKRFSFLHSHPRYLFAKARTDIDIFLRANPIIRGFHFHINGNEL
jgi:hypothetical protein